MDLQVGWPEGYNIMHKEPVEFYSCMWRVPYPSSKISASTYRGWQLKHQVPCLTHKVPPLLSNESQPSIYESKKTTSSFHWAMYRIQTGLFWEFGSCIGACLMQGSYSQNKLILGPYPTQNYPFFLMILKTLNDPKLHQGQIMACQQEKKDIHAGSVETSAETAQATPRFVKAPRISPQGK
jgi:hypothetical protein